MLDVDAIRRDFPILEREFQGKPLVYLDSAATSQKPVAVIEAEAEFYRHHNANAHRGILRHCRIWRMTGTGLTARSTWFSKRGFRRRERFGPIPASRSSKSVVFLGVVAMDLAVPGFLGAGWEGPASGEVERRRLRGRNGGIVTHVLGIYLEGALQDTLSKVGRGCGKNSQSLGDEVTID